MFFVFSAQGEWINKTFLKNKLSSLGETLLIGLVFQSIATTIVAFFFRINIEYFCVNMLISAIAAILYKNSIIQKIKAIASWDSFCKILLLLVFISGLVRSSLLPFVIDNDTYYIQTIKWINEYGWVKGITNLHLFLWQSSPWHALQAAFNFKFIANLFNDINGFLLFIMALIWLSEINKMRKNNDYTTNRWLYFLPLFLIFWIQFVDYPSTDFPLFVITPLIVYHTLNRSETGSLLSIILIVFLIFIKICIVPLALLLLAHVNIKNRKFFVSFSIITGSLFLIKNIWISGCPLAPYWPFKLDLSWTIPDNIEKMEGGDRFHFDDFLQSGWMNIFSMSLIIIAFIPYVCITIKDKKHYLYILFFFIEFVFVLFSVNQFKFVLPAVFFPIAYYLSKIKMSPKKINVLVYIFVCISIIPSITNLNYENISRNRCLLFTDTFDLKKIIAPAGITKFSALKFGKETCTNFDYYYPIDTLKFKYLTGDGPLPCVETRYLQYMYKYTGCLPESMGNDLRDGFRSTSNLNVEIEN